MTEEVQIRSLNDKGRALFLSTDWAKANNAGDPPKHILFDDQYSEVVIFSNGHSRRIDTEHKFSKKRELAIFLDEIFQGLETQDLLNQPGMWAWIALLYYEQLRQPILWEGEIVGWKKAESARYVLEGSSWRYYRHSVCAPFVLWRMYGEK